jgi:hypothetical protein
MCNRVYLVVVLLLAVVSCNGSVCADRDRPPLPAIPHAGQPAT